MTPPDNFDDIVASHTPEDRSWATRMLSGSNSEKASCVSSTTATCALTGGAFGFMDTSRSWIAPV